MLAIEKNFTVKRTFADIRSLILLSLASGQKTINQISSETSINWRTVAHHLIYLSGRGLVREAFSSSYVRIFELTAFGKDHLRRSGVDDSAIADKK